MKRWELPAEPNDVTRVRGIKSGSLYRRQRNGGLPDHWRRDDGYSATWHALVWKEEGVESVPFEAESEYGLRHHLQRLVGRPGGTDAELICEVETALRERDRYKELARDRGERLLRIREASDGA